MTEPTVVATHLTLNYRKTPALADVSFAVGRGIVGLLGPNGAGKSTLLRIIATATSSYGGDLRMLGRDPRNAQDRLEIRRRLGYLPQEPGFHPRFTAFEFIDYVAILKEMTDRVRRHAEVRRVLTAVGLADQQGKRIKALSGGMRQRVALAASLLGDPEILILDEPTVGLDPEQRLRFRELIADLGENRTVVLSTHQTEDVAMLCQSVVVLHQGQIHFEGSSPQLAALADGRVWSDSVKDPRAVAAWRSADGSYRNLGMPPDGAPTLPPTIEDGYLMLVQPTAGAAVAA
ncbi:ABC transporter ATP-binding protein [Actinoplanes sp. M2I2]|uniref:ABC transporter ATP-binding protein n=1 Tax=Actinoplanes sp. M2I2 TaxID=1734444 RepID=UPI0020205D6C|nr:ABC transporter ATP-binding protein [Actinoplanes sp. M2I2]